VNNNVMDKVSSRINHARCNMRSFESLFKVAYHSLTLDLSEHVLSL